MADRRKTYSFMSSRGSFDECARREVKEETGLDITGLQSSTSPTSRRRQVRLRSTLQPFLSQPSLLTRPKNLGILSPLHAGAGPGLDGSLTFLTRSSARSTPWSWPALIPCARCSCLFPPMRRIDVAINTVSRSL